MDVSRIELALREGPPDEPIYLPGSFRRSAPRATWLTFGAIAVGMALVIGIAIGSGLAVLRGEETGGPGPHVLVPADLLGTWTTDEISRQAWIDGATAAGFDASAIDAFLAHDPIADRVRYTLEFFTGDSVTDRVTIMAEYDGQPLEVLSGGGFAVASDGTLRYTEIVPGTAAPRCVVTLAADIASDQMTLEVQAMENCDADAELAHTAFFELAPYARQGP